jgi:hypothetical protein
MDTFYIYICFPKNINLSSIEEGKQLLKDIQCLIDRADCEKGSILFYDSANKDSFFDILDVYSESDMLGNFGMYSFQEVLSTLLLEANVKDWRKGTINFDDDDISYGEWLPNGMYLKNKISDLLKEITEQFFRLKDNNEKCLLLSIYNSSHIYNPIHIIKNQKGKNNLVAKVDFVSHFIELENWFLKNRLLRNYNCLDNRHVENHPNYIKKKSPILGGLGGKKHLKELLGNAIGDYKKIKYLINFDENNVCYVRYEDENISNQYHGYHLVKPITHERDIKEEKKIPERVKNLLQYRKKLRDEMDS